MGAGGGEGRGAARGSVYVGGTWPCCCCGAASHRGDSGVEQAHAGKLATVKSGIIGQSGQFDHQTCCTSKAASASHAASSSTPPCSTPRPPAHSAKSSPQPASKQQPHQTPLPLLTPPPPLPVLFFTHVAYLCTWHHPRQCSALPQ